LVRHVLIAEVDEEPILYPDSGSNRNYFGQIVDSDGGKQCAFLKVLDDRQLANEIIAYLAATSLSLPIPSACLALCPAEFLPGWESWEEPHPSNPASFSSSRPGSMVIA
jgi:hypothetical protein